MQARWLIAIIAFAAIGSATATEPAILPPAMPGFTPLERRPQPAEKPAPVAGPIDAVRVPTAADATIWALADIKLRIAGPNGDPHAAPYLRYLWVPPWGDISWHQINSFIVNSTASRVAAIQLPDAAANGWLIVWDLRRLTSSERELAELVAVWDSFAINDPHFHIHLPAGKTSPTWSHEWIDGKAYKARVFVPAPHVTPAYQLLEEATHSFAPLLRADYFLRKAISTQEDGRYYQLMGFIRHGKRLNRAEILKQVGLDVALSRAVEGDRRAAVFSSDLSDKPRTAEQLQGAVGRASIVYDIFKEDTNASQHPLYELENFVERARGQELIYELPNGLFGFVLFDGKGNLVDVAPPNLVGDIHAATPGTYELFPAIGCIRCHGPHSGVQPMRNDVVDLLSDGDRGDIDYLGELFSRRGREAVVSRIAGLYAASDRFQQTAALRRIDYADAVWRATNGMGVKDDEKVVEKCFSTISAQYADYWYTRGAGRPAVDPDRAALELGWQAKKGQGALLLQRLLPPRRRDVVIDGHAVEFADPALVALKRGKSIRRQDWDRIIGYASILASPDYENLLQKTEKGIHR